MSDFRIDIIDQYWLEEELASTDLCSHGRIFLKIGEVVVLDHSEDVDWTLSTTALRLLRSVRHGHSTETQDDIVLHCGQLIMVSCPIGIYFDVTLKETSVFISNIRKCLSVDEKETVSFPETITISGKHFAGEVLRFAEEVRAFFDAGPEKIIDDADDQQEWDDFWKEYEELLTFVKNLN